MAQANKTNHASIYDNEDHNISDDEGNEGDDDDDDDDDVADVDDDDDYEKALIKTLLWYWRFHQYCT